ncbi:MAG TPA: 5'-nucleotidase C-terminal domain-containing protein [Chloroflexota bacterium]|nr:5'-nucleotidase C-terminal domain-containing protein [Chloroflexota bacterium]
MSRLPLARALALALTIVAVAAALLPTTAQGQSSTSVVLLHTSDYHSHALPHYADGEYGVGGLARLIQYFRDEKAANPNTVILGGGDTMNLGTPAWSDKYQCAEWPLFNGLHDAMAFGNHELDYGWARFEECRASITYPILSAGFVSETNEPILRPWTVVERGGVRLGIFALVGSDFEKLIKPADRPEGARFVDGEKVAPAIILHLRQVEKVDAVISIGHRFYEEDVKLAQDVPGIDLIFATHSHRKEELNQIPGTQTWIISPFQYLEYVSRVELTFEGGKLASVGGGLVRMGPDRPEAPDVAAQVATMQRDLEADPKYAARFERLGKASVELSDANISSGESVLGNWVLDSVRAAARAQVALSTASSFRASIPPGDVTVEDYLTAVPYKNLVLVHEMTGAQLQQALDLSASKRGTDSFSQASGVRYAIEGGKATDVQVLASPAGSPTDPSAFEPLDLSATYLVATTDFQARIAAGYSDLFKQAASVTDTGIVVNDLMMDTLRTSDAVSAALDGRVR